jgi:hypothetical protein
MAIVRVSFVDGAAGEWSITEARAVCGDGLPEARSLSRREGDAFAPVPDGGWALHGVRSNERYLEREEKARLGAVQQGLDRPDSRHGALIPICKSAAWWDLPQDERRRIFEADSRHIAIGSEFLPAIARRLYHSRDLGGPFDFLTWFEFSPADEPAFDDLLGRLRATEEWRYVTREVELRLRRF